jgi:transposase InsO family protein
MGQAPSLAAETLNLKTMSFSKLKMEWLNERTFKSRSEARKAVFEYIELFYNRRRTHSSNGYVPPFQYENQ